VWLLANFEDGEGDKNNKVSAAMVEKDEAQAIVAEL